MAATKTELGSWITAFGFANATKSNFMATIAHILSFVKLLHRQSFPMESFASEKKRGEKITQGGFFHAQFHFSPPHLANYSLRVVDFYFAMRRHSILSLSFQTPPPTNIFSLSFLQQGGGDGSQCLKAKSDHTSFARCKSKWFPLWPFCVKVKMSCIWGWWGERIRQLLLFGTCIENPFSLFFFF